MPIRLFSLMVLSLLAMTQAHGRMAVRPMLLRLDPDPGVQITETITVRNPDVGREAVLNLYLAEIEQLPDGSITLIEDGRTRPYAAAAWARLDKHTLTLPPEQEESVTLTINTDPRVREFRCFAVVVEEAHAATSGPDQLAMGVLVRFVVPVFITPRGNTVLERVSLPGLESAQVEVGENERRRALKLGFENPADTLSYVEWYVQLYQQMPNGSWRPAGRTTPTKGGVFPGNTVQLATFLEPKVKPGTYKARAYAQTPNRRIKPLEAMVDIPAAQVEDETGAPAPLALDESFLSFPLRPRSREKHDVTLTNNASAPLQIRTEVAPLFWLKDDSQVQLDARDWVQVMPNHLTLQPGMSRPVHIVASTREEWPEKQRFANVRFMADAADGTTLGQELVLIFDNPDNVTAAPEFDVQRLEAYTDSGNHVVEALVKNIGVVAEKAQVEAILFKEGSEPLRAKSDATPTPLLPFASARMRCGFPAADLPEGNYMLSIRLVLDGDTLFMGECPADIVGSGEEAEIRLECDKLGCGNTEAAPTQQASVSAGSEEVPL